LIDVESIGANERHGAEGLARGRPRGHRGPPQARYPFRVERDSSSLPRHKLNLIFATCAQADALVERGLSAEAQRLLYEIALLEPQAGIVRDRIKALP
jgi:hypothetical protein